MADTQPQTTDRAAQLPPRWDTAYYDPDAVSGMVYFAAVVIGIAGALNVVHGIAALGDAKVFARHPDFVTGSLHTWGLVAVVIGVAQLCAAPGIWLRVEAARWIGVVTAAANTILQLLFLPAYPALSVALFALDVLVIYALVAEGGRGTSSI